MISVDGYFVNNDFRPMQVHCRSPEPENASEPFRINEPLLPMN
jgi:hypothetical protein